MLKDRSECDNPAIPILAGGCPIDADEKTRVMSAKKANCFIPGIIYILRVNNRLIKN
jgi:hypothetical protein